MAILRDVPGIKITIESNRKTLNEYDDDERGEWTPPNNISAPGGRQSSTYVECETGSEFQIRVELAPPFHLGWQYNCVAVWARVDGKHIGGKSFTRNHLANNFYSDKINGVTARIDAAQVSTRPLKFCSISKVDTSDPVRVNKDVKLAKGLGEIIVIVHCANEDHIPLPVRIHRRNNFEPVKEIAEKALKGQAISHGVEYGPETRRVQNQHFEFTYPDGEKNPVGAFRFKYRSREALQQQLVIPRSPSPEVAREPLQNRIPNVGNHREERLAKLKREIAAIKAEEQDDNNLGHKRSSEGSEIPQSGKRYKTSRKRDGRIVVDLTDD
ncbi:hypothetical protein B7494_g9 [Chlorociboria aeruginascens]|nr:hypothetical protein B7494_g9 [Chlorociboria aeruginascens]